MLKGTDHFFWLFACIFKAYDSIISLTVNIYELTLSLWTQLVHDSLETLQLAMTLANYKMKICFSFLTFVTIFVCKAFECDWNAQYLCGDQCLLNFGICHCGNDSFSFQDAYDYYCCHQPNTCTKSYVGGIKCEGQIKPWNHLCNGSCRQNSRFGHTMLPCKDQTGCYEQIFACRGKPECIE